MATEPNANGPKARKRTTAKPGKTQTMERAKLTLYLDGDLARRFAVHAAMLGMDKSELFAELVRAGCDRFVTSDRKKPKGEATDAGDPESEADAA